MTGFAERHELAERAVARYERALSALTEGSLAAERVATGLAVVRAELARVARLVQHGERTIPGTYAGRSRRDPSVRLSRRQKLTPAERHLHNLHRSLVRLERAADAAEGVAVARALNKRSTADPVEEALELLARVLSELQRC